MKSLKISIDEKYGDYMRDILDNRGIRFIANDYSGCTNFEFPSSDDYKRANDIAYTIKFVTSME